MSDHRKRLGEMLVSLRLISPAQPGRVLATQVASSASLKTNSKLSSLQALRAIAATLVVFYHLTSVEGTGFASTLGRAASAAYSGVDIFFVLSGFIIFYAHRRDLGRPDRAGSFRKRALRILPMYWVVTGAKRLLVRLPGFRSVHYSIVDMLVSASLLPILGTQRVLSVSWSLTCEMLFYGVFLIAIFASRRFLPMALAI